MQKELISYIRMNRNPIGVVIARRQPTGIVEMDISVCNPKDKFDKKRALSIARERLDNPNRSVFYVPNRIEKRIVEDSVVEINVVQEAVNRMYCRAVSYFKN